jgi:hypothetical protein
MEVKELKALVPGLLQKGHPEKIKIFGWYLHVYQNKETFHPADIKDVYDELHDNAPSSFSGYFKNLVSQKCILKNTKGYRLTGATRDEINAAYAPTGNKVQMSSLLKNLPNLIPNLAERTYLNETLICYENGAFRAAIVMTWNLAYHHLCDHILKNRLADFNARWVIKFAGMHKNGTKTIKVIDDFMDELKESEVIVIAKDAGVITKNVFNIMEEKLKKRNSAAHASGIVINQLQADAYIDDVVNNVVLKLV